MEVKIYIDGKPYIADSSNTILKVARDNGIENPNLIFPGQKLIIK